MSSGSGTRDTARDHATGIGDFDQATQILPNCRLLFISCLTVDVDVNHLGSHQVEMPPSFRLSLGRFMTTTETPAEAKSEKVSPPTLTAMVIGSMIGFGVFLLPRRFGGSTPPSGSGRPRALGTRRTGW